MYLPHLEVFKTKLTFQTPDALSPAPSPALPLLYLLKFLVFWSTLQEHTHLQQGFSWTRLHHFSNDFNLARFSEIIALDVYDSTENTRPHLLIYWFEAKDAITLLICEKRPISWSLPDFQMKDFELHPFSSVL